MPQANRDECGFHWVGHRQVSLELGWELVEGESFVAVLLKALAGFIALDSEDFQEAIKRWSAIRFGGSLPFFMQSRFGSGGRKPAARCLLGTPFWAWAAMQSEKSLSALANSKLLSREFGNNLSHRV